MYSDYIHMAMDKLLAQEYFKVYTIIIWLIPNADNISKFTQARID